MLESKRFEFIAPENLHMRPCAVITEFSQMQERNHDGINISLATAQKTVKATSIIAITLLGIKKGDTLLLEITGGSNEEINQITRDFSELVKLKLGEIHLHEIRESLLSPVGAVISNNWEKHPEYEKFQELYTFLLRIQALLIENEVYFLNPESLSKIITKNIKETFERIVQEEDEILTKLSLSLPNGGHCMSWLCDDRCGNKQEEYSQVINYTLRDNIINAQRHLGILPREILDPIYHNLKILINIQFQLGQAEDTEKIYKLCNNGIDAMIPNDKGSIHGSVGHDFIADYRFYKRLISDGESKNESSKRYLNALQEDIQHLLGHVQEFLFPTRLCTYEKNG